MAKRANGEGNVYQRANGTWEARFSYLDPDTGVRRRVSFYGPSAKAVRAKLKTARERLDAGAPVKDATRTVGDWLAHWRATTLAVSDRKESTRVLYANLSRKHLESAPFGAIPLDRLRPTNVEALVLAMRAKTLSDSTIRQTYTVLRAGSRRCGARRTAGTQSCGPGGASRCATHRGQALERQRRGGCAEGRTVLALSRRRWCSSPPRGCAGASAWGCRGIGWTSTPER